MNFSMSDNVTDAFSMINTTIVEGYDDDWIGVENNETFQKVVDGVVNNPQNFDPSDSMIFPFFVQIIGVLVFFLLKRFKIPIPYAACIFIIGTFMGMASEMLHEHNGADDKFTNSILQWTRLDDSLILLIFLPGLIFKDAIEVNFDVFMLSLSQTLLLAFPSVLVGTGLIAVVCVYVLPYGWSWSLGATLGAILSSTDPVAVSAVLNEAGAPPRLKMLISSESLINDGSALVFFTIFEQIYLSPLEGDTPVGWGDGIAMFFKMALGGLAVGIVSALLLVVLLYDLDRRLDPEYNVLQAMAAISMAYISYYLADQIFVVSGVIACVSCGVISAWLGKGLINDKKLMSAYLAIMEHFLNTLLFALGGSMWGAVLFGKIGWRNIWAEDWGYLVVFYLLVMVIRFFQIGLFYPLLSRIGLKTNVRESVFLAFGGLRGAVGIALADNLFRKVLHLELSIGQQTDYTREATTLVFLSGGISLGTLLLNGTAAGPVIRLLGLNLPEASRDEAIDLYETGMGDFATEQYEKLLTESRFQNVEDKIVKAHVPFLKERAAERQERGSLAMSTISQPDLQKHTERIHRMSTVHQTKKDIVPEMRVVFLDLLRTTYTTIYSRGYLNEKEDEALNVDIFCQSVDFAGANVKEQPLNDWESLQIFQNCHEDAKTILRQRFQGTWRRILKKNKPLQDSQTKYKQTRTKVLRAVCFIYAHERANERLDAYMDLVTETSGRSNSIIAIQEALAAVKEESRAEVIEAEAALMRCEENLRNFIMSHYVATIILNRLSKHVADSLEEGSLSADEARSYLDQIEESAPNHHVKGNFCDCQQEDGGNNDCDPAPKSHVQQDYEKMEAGGAGEGPPAASSGSAPTIDKQA